MSVNRAQRLLNQLVPCVDISTGRCTDPAGIPDLADPLDPVEVVSAYVSAGARQVFLDIVDPWDQLDDAVKVITGVAATAADVFVSLDHGRLSSVESCGLLLDAGAAAVSVNTSVVTNPRTVAAAAGRFGAKRMMGAVNARTSDGGPRWTAYINGGRTSTGIDAVSFGRTLSKLGVGMVLANGADREGTGRGFDHALTRAMASATRLPVIASGGAKTIGHLREAVTDGGATFVLANKMLHSGSVLAADIEYSQPRMTRR
ncbi:imidazole glycerol phosphate synthase subunit HisF [Amycolatopsis rubida]|uniref:Imidazole glycerol phosphate synthase subunit HisF n=1 Tax=Amycolatopsis rubida TaxID=112413 RepID=A0ABX0BT32_9PSEU|nr:HisA/HisF-related TIM barrel protein [Amycolatopsis sp. M39]MYW93799.1 imidazole glycerol phosphate synthase subunit HisF [Amycolatopsis rubida]NEC58789.1 imidazole glycerol phosphate synthase subunit HisF [Amycolatopsis rubida]OAP22989.1 Imidazole glycerol phosphate synthase subunit HisF [Amycolatopsis sp. M39]